MFFIYCKKCFIGTICHYLFHIYIILMLSEVIANKVIVEVLIHTRKKKRLLLQ